MKQIFLCFLPLLLLGICSCAAPEKKLTPAEAGYQEKFRNDCRIIGEKMLLAFQKDKPQDFLVHLNESARKKFGEQQFRTSRTFITDTLGEIVSYQYLTVLESPGFHPMIWRIRFRRKAKDGQAYAFQETLFRIVFGDDRGTPTIISFYFL